MSSPCNHRAEFTLRRRDDASVKILDDWRRRERVFVSKVLEFRAKLSNVGPGSVEVGAGAVTRVTGVDDRGVFFRRRRGWG